MGIGQLIGLQGMMLVLIAIGLFLRARNIISAEGEKSLSALVIMLVLPASILRSFLEGDAGLLRQFGMVLVVATVLQIGCVLLGKVLYKNALPNQKGILQFSLICSNAAFLGGPVAESVFGSVGMLYSAIYLVPQRIAMWTIGLAPFTGGKTAGKGLLKKLLHPCILAVVIGLAAMLLQVELPVFLNTALQALASCTTPLSMLVIGMALAQVQPRSLFEKQVVGYTVVRLLGVPLMVLFGCLLFHVDVLVTGVCVLLSAMPAGASTVVVANQYGADSAFAAKCVMLSTLVSLFSTPLWSLMLTSKL